MKKFGLTAAILSASLALAACGDAGEETAGAEDMSAAGEATTETVVVDDGMEAMPAEDGGSTLTVDNNGASMDVNEPGVDATADSDGNVNAEVQM